MEHVFYNMHSNHHDPPGRQMRRARRTQCGGYAWVRNTRMYWRIRINVHIHMHTHVCTVFVLVCACISKCARVHLHWQHVRNSDATSVPLCTPVGQLRIPVFSYSLVVVWEVVHLRWDSRMLYAYDSFVTHRFIIFRSVTRNEKFS